VDVVGLSIAKTTYHDIWNKVTSKFLLNEIVGYQHIFNKSNMVSTVTNGNLVCWSIIYHFSWSTRRELQARND